MSRKFVEKYNWEDIVADFEEILKQVRGEIQQFKNGQKRKANSALDQK